MKTYRVYADNRVWKFTGATVEEYDEDRAIRLAGLVKKHNPGMDVYIEERLHEQGWKRYTGR